MQAPSTPASSADSLPLRLCYCRAHYGPRWKRPPSSQLTKSMRDKLNGYRGNLMQARILNAVPLGRRKSRRSRAADQSVSLLHALAGVLSAGCLSRPSSLTRCLPVRRPSPQQQQQAGDSDKRLQEKLAAEAAAFAALDPEAAATQMPKMQVRVFLCF